MHATQARVLSTAQHGPREHMIAIRVQEAGSSLRGQDVGSFHGRQHAALAAGMVQSHTHTNSDPQLLSLVFTLAHSQAGALKAVLEAFASAGLNLTHIESRPSKQHGKYEFSVDFEGTPADERVQRAIAHIRSHTQSVTLAEPLRVPWFPRSIGDIDHFSTKTLDAGAELEADHPGFHDATYRTRRTNIVANASTYRHGERIPTVEYSAQEVETWAVVYKRLQQSTRAYGVAQYNDIMPQMERHCGYGERSIPQLQDISEWLSRQTGFSLRPVGGLLSARDFLNALAFRVFFSTQYIRHHTKPLYTPEPDIVHELMGHAPMFADPDFADFSHEIGLASLGASDDDIKKLATCYWFSVEFGLCMQDGHRKAYGAGLLSSFGELEYACAPFRPAGGEDKFPEYRPWEPAKAAVQPYPITTYQPVYFVAESLSDAKERMREYCASLRKGFNIVYDPLTKTVSSDRALIRGQYQVTLQK